jgi:ubiquinone/menaquinone biosynthesis C-methylase UbiE
LSFIEDASVDFVLANGLLCNVPEGRPLIVGEIQRVLKSTGRAYLSLGMHRPFGFVDSKEWETILGQFKVEQRGGFLQKWALVSKRDDGEDVSKEYVESTKRPQLLKFRKKLGE